MEPPGFQLADPEIVHQSRPGLFDEIPRHLLNDAHCILDAWPHAGDRMMLAPLLPVSLQAQRVANALLWHGWSSFPSRESISAFSKISDLSNISKGLKELEKAGVMSKRQRTDSGRGYAGNRYTFRGLVVCQFLADCYHPGLAAAAQAVLDYHAGLEEAENSRGVRDTPRATDAPAEAEISRGVRDTPRATDGPAEAEISRGVRDTPRATGGPAEAENSRGVRDTPRATEAESRGVCDTPRDSPGEGDVVSRGVCHTPPGGYDIPYNHDDDLIDIENNLLNQSDQSINPGVRGVPPTPRVAGPGEGRGVPPTPRGNGGDVCAACGSAEFNGEVCAACGVLPAVPDARLGWPAWYREFAARLPAKNVPEWGDVEQDRLAAGWSDAVLQEAAARYERSYSGQRVSAPSSLFRSIAVGVADELARSRGGRGGQGGVREPGGASESGPANSEPVLVEPAACSCEELAAAAAPPDPEAQGKWAACLELLRQEVSTSNFETWLEGSEGLRYVDDDLVVRVTSVFAAAWLEQRMYQNILRAVRTCCGSSCDVHFESVGCPPCQIHGPVEPVEPS